MKPKLAICISGQTRIHNSVEDEFHHGLKALFGSEFDYDLYAHTWNDQVLPTQAHRYTVLRTTDQSQLWKHMVSQGNPFSAMILTEKLQNTPEYHTAISGESSLVNLMEKCITGIYSQLVSAWHAFDSVNEPEKYSAFVRFRWDITARHPDWDNVEFAKNVRSLVESNSLQSTAIAVPLNHGLFMGDMCIGFTPQLYQRLVDEHIHNIIHNMTNHKPELQLESSHRLWENLIKYLGGETVYTDEDPIQMFDHKHTESHKPNKTYGY